MSQSDLRNYVHQTELKVDRMLAMIEGVPIDRLQKKPDPEAWSVMEVLCHVEEALMYWMQELMRVTENKGGEWGRGLQHEGRLAAVASADTRSLQSVVDGLKKARRWVNDTLMKLEDGDLNLQAPHRNPKFGIKPMSFLLDHFVVEHLDAHIGQIERNLRG